MDQFKLAAGQKHPITFAWTEDGQPDPSAKVVSWTSNTDQVSPDQTPPQLDLTDATPGSEIEVDITATVQFGDSSSPQTISLKGMVTVDEPVTAAPANPATPPATTPVPATPTAAPESHVYTGSLIFDAA